MRSNSFFGLYIYHDTINQSAGKVQKNDAGSQNGEADRDTGVEPATGMFYVIMAENI